MFASAFLSSKWSNAQYARHTTSSKDLDVRQEGPTEVAATRLFVSFE